jgi:ubiquitin-like protein Pup
MPDRELKKKNPARAPEVEEAQAAAPSESGARIKAELDDLLDEIDDVLETNAEDFVKSYVQKGGQ